MTQPASTRIFAANRSAGHIALHVEAPGGITRRARVHEDGSLRVRFPNRRRRARSRDRQHRRRHGWWRPLRLDIAVDEGARLIAGTAAAEKIYRSIGPEAEMDVRLDVGAGARLAWLPQETILFDRARLSRRIDVDLADGASLLMAEAIVFGRSAMGETMSRAFRRPLAGAPRRPADVRRERAARRRRSPRGSPRRRRPPAASPSRPCWSCRATRR